MKDHAYKDLFDIYSERKRELEKIHKAELQELKENAAKEQDMLEKQCITEHGHHKDDGGMFYGMCVRCGWTEG